MEPTGSLQSKCYPNSVIEELVGWGLNRAQFKLIYFHLTPRRAAWPLLLSELIGKYFC